MPMPRPNQSEFLRYILKEHQSAIHFCELLGGVSQTIDDLVDRDNSVTDEDLYSLFWSLLVDLNSNRFFVQYRHIFTPLFAEYLTSWFDANTLEKQGDHQKNIAFVLRDNFSAIVIHCARLVGGYEWMRKVSATVREHVFEETLEDYKADLLNREVIE